MLRRDLGKLLLEEKAIERLMRHFRAGRPADLSRREAREILFAEDHDLTEASFVRAWNEATRRSTLERSEAEARTARDEPTSEPRGS